MKNRLVLDPELVIAFYELNSGLVLIPAHLFSPLLLVPFGHGLIA